MKNVFGIMCCYVFSLLLSVTVDARANLCDQTDWAKSLLLEYSVFQSANVKALPGIESDMFRTQWEAMVFGNSTPAEKVQGRAANVTVKKSWLAGIGHEYTSAEFDPQISPDPLSNGDLHTLYIPVHWRQQNPQNALRLSVVPAISVSSNVLKNPDKLNSDSLQLWLAFEYQQQVYLGMQWILGACADHRFGHYQGYPVAGLQWQPNERWYVRLAYPDTAVRYRFASPLTLQFTVNPDGNEWQVLDETLKRRSKYSRQAWRLEGRLSWQFSPELSLGLAVGKSLEQELQFSLEDNRNVKTDIDNASYGKLILRWTFTR